MLVSTIPLGAMAYMVGSEGAYARLVKNVFARLGKAGFVCYDNLVSDNN